MTIIWFLSLRINLGMRQALHAHQLPVSTPAFREKESLRRALSLLELQLLTFQRPWPPCFDMLRHCNGLSLCCVLGNPSRLSRAIYAVAGPWLIRRLAKSSTIIAKIRFCFGSMASVTFHQLETATAAATTAPSSSRSSGSSRRGAAAAAASSLSRLEHEVRCITTGCRMLRSTNLP